MKTIPIPGRINTALVETEYQALDEILHNATWRGWGDIELSADSGHLRSLTITAGNLKAIPPQIACFPFLERLNLGYNDIALIEHLDQLKHLRELNLMANSLRSMQGIENLAALEKLTLFFNLITRIEGLEKLENLLHLDLNSNCIETISGVNHLKKLRGLYLHDNAISQIENLEGLDRLEELTLWSRTQPFRSFVRKQDFRSNAIEKVDNIAGLPALRLLDLTNNRVTAILCDLPRKLERLILTLNPIAADIPLKWQHDPRLEF